MVTTRMTFYLLPLCQCCTLGEFLGEGWGGLLWASYWRDPVTRRYFTQLTLSFPQIVYDAPHTLPRACRLGGGGFALLRLAWSAKRERDLWSFTRILHISLWFPESRFDLRSLTVIPKPRCCFRSLPSDSELSFWFPGPWSNFPMVIMIASTSLWSSKPRSDSPSLTVISEASMWFSKPRYDFPSLVVIVLASLWPPLSRCESPSLTVISQASLWFPKPHCDSSSLVVIVLAPIWSPHVSSAKDEWGTGQLDGRETKTQLYQFSKQWLLTFEFCLKASLWKWTRLVELWQIWQLPFIFSCGWKANCCVVVCFSLWKSGL